MGGEYAHIKTGINGTCAFTNGKVPVMNDHDIQNGTKPE